MALSSYAELKSAVADYMGRDGDTGFVAQIPTFVALCEARINRVMRNARNETTATLTTDANGQASLPTGYRQMRTVSISGDYGMLEYLPYHEAESLYGDSPATDYPSAYSVKDRTLHLFPKFTGSVQLVYHSALDALSDSATSNWVLANHPDVYLFGTLVEACVFAGLEDQRVAIWEQKFAGALDDMRMEDQGARWGRARAQVPDGIPS